MRNIHFHHLEELKSDTANCIQIHWRWIKSKLLHLNIMQSLGIHYAFHTYITLSSSYLPPLVFFLSPDRSDVCLHVTRLLLTSLSTTWLQLTHWLLMSEAQHLNQVRKGYFLSVSPLKTWIQFTASLKDNYDNLCLNSHAIRPLRLITNFDRYFYEYRIHEIPLCMS